jgi:hypothetical protein
MRYASLLLLLTALLLTRPSSTVAASASQTTISGGGITQPIRFTAVDETALFQRINFPPKLDDAPAVTGPSYALTSPYWPKVLPGNGKDRLPAGQAATYYPQGGFVKARQGADDVWLALDLRQRAIIQRYVSLGEQRLLPPEPGVIDVLRAAAALRGEDIGVQAGGRELSSVQAGGLWSSLAGVAPMPLAATQAPPSTVPANDAWLVFTLAEGRDLRLYYDSTANQIVDYAGQQSYPVPRAWLPLILGPDAQSASMSYAPLAVPREKGQGSPAWWVLMVAGGAASLTLAVVLRRRWA